MPVITNINADIERTTYDDADAVGLNVHLEDLEELGSLVSKDLGRRMTAIIKRWGVSESTYLFPTNPTGAYVLISAGYGYTPSGKEVRLESPYIFQVSVADDDKYITIEHKVARDQSRVNVDGEVFNIRKKTDTNPNSVIAIEDIDASYASLADYLAANPDKIVLGKLDIAAGPTITAIDTTEATGYRQNLLATNTDKITKSGDDVLGSLVFDNAAVLFHEITDAAYKSYQVVATQGVTFSGLPPADNTKELRFQSFYAGTTLSWRLYDPDPGIVSAPL